MESFFLFLGVIITILRKIVKMTSKQMYLSTYAERVLKCCISSSAVMYLVISKKNIHDRLEGLLCFVLNHTCKPFKQRISHEASKGH